MTTTAKTLTLITYNPADPRGDTQRALELICALLRGEHGPELQAHARAAVGRAWSTCPRTASLEPGIIMLNILRRTTRTRP